MQVYSAGITLHCFTSTDCMFAGVYLIAQFGASVKLVTTEKCLLFHKRQSSNSVNLQPSGFDFIARSAWLFLKRA